tara:strand:- start:248 stop:553 length:306 start_codon:yes stop_codon:yes gene_type:complete
MDNKDIPVFKNWSIKRPDCSFFIAPECIKPLIMGSIFNHPNYKDGTNITTSSIVEVNGNKIKTISGSFYLIEGEPSLEYKEYCYQNNIMIDLNNPILTIKL